MQQQEKSVNSQLNAPHGIMCHAYSPDNKYIAISTKDSNQVEIYQIGDLKQCGTWNKINTLSREHTSPITVIDWSANNQILTGSYDRQVIIWKYENDQWKYDLVILQDNNKRAVLCGSWDNRGKKFAIGSATHKLFVGFWEEDNKWWFGYKYKGAKSSIVSLKFHPSDRVVGYGSTDFNFYLATCYIEQADKDNTYKGIFDNITSSDEIILKIRNNGWVESLNFTLDGSQFVYAAHDSTIKVHKISEQLKEDGSVSIESEQEINYNGLPFRELLFASNKQILAAGYDLKPIIFSQSGDKWSLDRKLEQNETSLQFTKARQSAFHQTMSKFSGSQNQSLKTQDSIVKNEEYQHQTPIICMRTYQKSGQDVSLVSTNDELGNIFYWRL